ncbi:vWA domain-containing protein [Rhodococcoides corynebacterioides]|uniref:vWA domain-containing protein n=1 Tax=Rhodococcoides corynebacterioides TaxID=53972 RepID=UPI001C9BAC10|nr:VWA domain-containing protein [Rhodococcus corynebacterioides]MBY6351421.1 VWA domain-containing protein [Rhodococcus corynebacterioides]
MARSPDRPPRSTRYGPYVDGPDPLAPPVDLREALEAIGRDVLEGSSPRRALQEMLRRGTRSMRGLDDLAARANRKRRELLKNRNLDGTLQEVRELLDKAVLEERKALARALDDDARFAEMQLADLPPSTAQAVQELAEYDWRSSEARENYEKIKDLLGREVLDQRFQGMKQALEGATEEDRARVQQMLSDLNDLLDAHARGEDTDQQFRDFMAEHGEFFPENPQSVDELIDALAQRSAAAQRLRNSLSADQRAELDALAQQAFGSPDLMDQLARLDANLQSARPGEDWDGSQNFRGQQGMGLGDGTGMLQDIAELEDLGDQLSQQYNGAALDDIDADALLRQLGPEAAADARMLADLEKALQQEGFLDKGADGQWRLSPKAMRQLGQAALRDVAGSLASRRGERDTRRAGAMGEPTGASRAWEFGDTEPWDVVRTVTNAVLRTAAEPRSETDAVGVRLAVTDVEITETEQRSQAAVALLVDTSFSMVMEGRWVPMKQTALALNHLVSTRFRGDALTMIGFGRHAQTLTPSELAGLDGAWDQGTNLHHALMLAVRHLRRHPNAQPVVLIVTDGEPTAHLEPDGQAVFDYPPSARTLGLTVRELDTVARIGAQVTIFRLGDDPGLARVVDRMAHRVGGRVIAPDLDGLGAAVVSDYLSSRKRR